MHVIIEKDVHSCDECPASYSVFEMGYHGRECIFINDWYSPVPRDEIDKRCPFLKIKVDKN